MNLLSPGSQSALMGPPTRLLEAALPTLAYPWDWLKLLGLLFPQLAWLLDHRH